MNAALDSNSYVTSSGKSSQKKWNPSKGNTSKPNSAAADALGWFSIGLGLTELLAPRQLSRWLGVKDSTALIRGFGAREFANGVGLLASTEKDRWLWARVLGDGMDLATLAAALKQSKRKHIVAGAVGAVGAITALDLWAAVQQRKAAQKPIRASTLIGATPDELYRMWRDLKRAPEYMVGIKSVEELDSRRSKWTAMGPSGSDIEWESEILEDIPGEKIAWASTDSGALAHRGTVFFEPANSPRGTLVLVQIEPALKGLPSLASALRVPEEWMIRQNLRRFRSLVEIGDIVTTQGQPHGQRSMLGQLLEEVSEGEQP